MPEPQPSLLRCLTCGNVAEVKPADLLRFARTRNWPRCCEEVMALFTLADPDRQPLADPTGGS